MGDGAGCLVGCLLTWDANEEGFRGWGWGCGCGWCDTHKPQVTDILCRRRCRPEMKMAKTVPTER